MSTTENPATPAGPPMLPVQAQALNDAMNALPLETLQAERAELVKLQRDTSAFDAAIAAKGGAPTNAAVVKDYAAHGIALGEAKPEDYSSATYGKLAHTLAPERLAAVRQESSAWAAQLGLSSEMGAQVISRMVDVGQIVGAMSPAEQEDWAARQDEISLRIVKTPAMDLPGIGALLATPMSNITDDQMAQLPLVLPIAAGGHTLGRDGACRDR
jgi:hypothetical protein